MTKEDYFKISDKLKLSRRCPIYDYCERRVWSVFLSTYFLTSNKSGALSSSLADMKSEGDIPQDYEQNEIQMVGETPEIYKGSNDFFYFKEFCPEVALFSSHRLTPALAISSASYVKNPDEWSVEREEYKHFSECLEFCKCQNKSKTSSKVKRREGISLKTRWEVLVRDNFACQYCKRTEDEGIKLEIDHKIPVSKNGTNDIDNLITSCFDCNRGKSNKDL